MNKITILLSAAIILATCTKEEVTPRGYPRVNTLEVTDITSGGARFMGEIIFSSVPVKDHGFLWSEYSDAIFENSDKISLGPKSGTGLFEANCDRSLEEGKTYYVRAYATSEDYNVYGDVVKFVSLGSKAPVLKDFYPALATWGDTITIVGENFSAIVNNNVIKFNAVPASVLKVSIDTLIVIVPLALTADVSDISISRIGNISTATKQFTLKAPALESVNPSIGTIGSNVIITGQFIKSQKTKVYFNDVEGIFLRWGLNSVAYKAPSNLSVGPVEIKVVTGSGSLFATLPFEIQGPQLLQVIPAVAGEGDEIKLTGDFFSDDIELNTVTFDNSLATVVWASKTELRVIVPPYVDAINPTISVSIAESITSADLFSFHAPEIESFSPQRGVYGTQLTINGKYFKTASFNKVFIGDMELSYVHGNSPNEINASIYELYSKHSEQIKVTFHEQEGFSVMKFNMPWISISDYPEPYNTPSASLTYNNKVYAGFSDGEYNRFWKFDPVNRAWNQLNDFPGTRRQRFGFTAGSKGYVAGSTEYLVIAPELWEYDFANDSWTKKLDPPIAGVIRAAFGLQNKGYMLENNQTNTQLWKYNQNTDTWTMESTAPFSLGIDPGYFVIGNILYLIVGNELWKYDASTNQWTNLGYTPAYMSHAFAIGNSGYGLNDNKMFKYDPNQNIWTLELSPLQYFTTPSNVFSVNGRGFVITGNGLTLEYDPSF